MKRVLTVLGILALAAVGLWAAPYIGNAAQSLFTNDDPDVPRMWKNAMSKEEYMLKRDEHVALLRGVGTGLPFDPALRIQAIEQLNEQQRRLLGAAEGGSGTNPGAQSGQSAGAASASAITGTWTPIGPFPIPNGQTVGVSTAVSGRTVAIAVHPTNADIAYVGTAQGGLYRTTDGGASWVPLMDNSQSLAIGTLTLAPSNPEILFVGTGEPTLSGSSFFGVGIYRIENASSASPTIVGPINKDAGGNNVFSGRAVGKIVVHPTDPNIIFAGTTFGIGGIGGRISLTQPLPSRGLFRSTNAMSESPAFEKLTFLGGDVGKDRDVVDMVMDPGDPNRIVLSTTGVPAIGAAPADNGGLYLTTSALQPNPIFSKTLDIAGTTSTATRTELAIKRIGSIPTIYAASGLNAGTVFRSSDGGQSWLQTVDNDFCSPQCFYDIAIDIDPTNADRVYLGGSPELAFGISTNGGTSFTPSQQGLHVDSHAIAVAPSNPNVVYFGSDGGIYRSNNAGATWTSLSNATFSATQFMSVAIHPTDPHFSIGGTQDNGTEMLRFDGTWTRTDYGDGGYAAIDQNSPATGATMYHTYYNSNAAGGPVLGYAFSEDANAFENWSFRGCTVGGTGNGIGCTDSVLFYAPLELGPGNPNTVYYGTDRLYRSENKGLVHTLVSQAPIEVNSTITPPGLGIPISAIGISPTNDNLRIVGLRLGGIWGTTTGSPVLTNLDPSNQVPNAFVARAAIDPNDPNTAYVTLSAFGVNSVWKTTNLASPTWTSASGSGDTAIPQVPVNAFVIDPTNSNRLLAGTDIGVYSSEDGGASWTPVGSDLPRVAVFDMGINSERKLRIATHGKGMWEIALPGFTPAPSNPIFAGLAQVTDSQQCDRLTLTWLPATSTNPNADMAYDIYRVSSVPEGDGTQEPAFIPSAANRIASAVRGMSYIDTGLTRNQPYYYIVQARDLNNGRIDANNTGNRVVRFGAPSSPNTGGTALFANETFDTSAANDRFTPALQDSATPDQGLPAFQRVPGIDFGGASSTGMYAPDFDPGTDGANSDFSAIIGPFTLTADSVMEFDHFFFTEGGFDGGLMELALSAPSFNATPFPDNTTTFDLGNHIFQNGYNGKLDGGLSGVMLSHLQGRRAFTGSRGLARTKISLRAFAPGGPLNPSGLPVYIRFRMTSDVGTAAGPGSGWYIDNVSISDLGSCVLPPPPAPNVTSMVSLATANPRSTGGVSQYDLTIKNISSQTIYAPMRLEVASVSSASGRVTVANADNGQTGAGASWDYSTKIGGDNALTPNETSLARTLKFNNPNNEAFTVNFRITGYLDPAAAAAAASAGGGSSGGGGSGGSGGGTASSGTNPAGTATTMVYSLTYNPLLNTIQLRKL